ncbi:MAG: DUF742 domain-containing protein [Streptomycetaceae bacterium]|nr:DUF742 domain-containing protein [Streptomycetaceae bacterium]
MSRPEELQGFSASSGYGRLVRPFTLTGGRTQPVRNVFSLITLITAVEVSDGPDNRSLQPEHHRILRLCPRPIAVAEIAAHLDIPVSVTTIMLSDLLDAGRISARPPIQAYSGQSHKGQSYNGPEIALLQKVRDGLARL